MMNLSNWSINLLKNDNQTWYKWYVLWERESEFQTYFAIGKTFAEIVEQFHKTWSWDTDRHVEKMKQEFIVAQATDEDWDKSVSQLYELVENAKIVVTERTDRSEFESIIRINENYSLKSKYDALWDGLVEDYKSVTSFTKEEEKLEKYWQQIRLYQYSEYKRTGEKIKGKITEIKKGRPTLPQKKDDLIALFPEWADTTGTIAELRARLLLYTTKDQVSQELHFEWEDSIIDYVEDLLRRAIIKANWLQTLPSLNDVL